MSLANELAQTNALLREAVKTPPPAAPPANPLNRPVDRFRASAALIAADRFWGMHILGDNFRPVPDDRYDRRGKDVTIHCSCGCDADLSFGQLASCRCGRWYWAGTAPHWAPAPEPDEHECQPQRLRLPSGEIVTADYCGECGQDLA